MSSSSLSINDLLAAKGASCQGALDIVNEVATKQLLDQVEHAKRSKKINVRQKLTVAEADAFHARYGGAFDLNLTQQYNAPHSLAGALRIAEHYDCLNSFPPDDAVIDIGGSWWHHYARGDHRVHSCCPILGPRDAARHEERMCRFRKLLQESNDFCEPPNFCLNKAEDCRVQADWAICIHGGYDLGFQGLCEAMHSHGVRILRGTIMFDGAMLFDRQGIMPLLNCRWKREGSGKKEMIKFDFINESTLSYVHEWRNLSSFLTSSTTTIGGTTYLIEREVLKCNIMTYKIIATHLFCPVETLRHCVWFENISQYVAVKIPSDWSLVHWRTVRVAKATVREVEEISFRCFKDNKDWTENMKAVASILSAKSSTVIINGQAIMAGERLDLMEYHLVAFSLTLNLYQKFERLRNFQGRLEWNGWLQHLKTRWMRKNVANDGKSWIRIALESFPALRLDTYKDSLVFLTGISDVMEFESDSVPASLLDRLLLDEDAEDLTNRVNDELLDAFDRRKRSPKVQVEPEVFFDAPATVDVSDDVKKEVAPSIESVPVVLNETVRIYPEDRDTDPDMLSRRSAINEFSSYCKRLHENASSNLRHMWSICGGKSNEMRNATALDTYHRVDDMVNVHLPGGNWKYPLKYEYTIGYNDSGLGPKSDKELFIVDKTCVCANHEPLAEACKNLPTPGCKITLVDGVAGCGKTTAIKNSFRAGEDLIVTANRKSAEDVREALFPHAPEGNVALSVVRTADSALMHGLPPCTRLLVDEVSLLHYGQLLAVAALCRCSEVLAFGDSEQITFASRDRTFRLNHEKLVYDERSVVCTTYRCPQDVVAAVKHLKKKTGNRQSKYMGWESRSRVSKSLSTQKISSVNQVILDRGKVYLTMTQADKAALRTRAKDFAYDSNWVDSHIKTVHEAQGISVDHVVLVRLKSTKCDLYKTCEYCLVALTRHKVSFTYMYNGCLMGDMILSCCENARVV